MPRNVFPLRSIHSHSRMPQGNSRLAFLALPQATTFSLIQWCCSLCPPPSEDQTYLDQCRKRISVSSSRFPSNNADADLFARGSTGTSFLRDGDPRVVVEEGCGGDGGGGWYSLVASISHLTVYDAFLSRRRDTHTRAHALTHTRVKRITLPPSDVFVVEEGFFRISIGDAQ